MDYAKEILRITAAYFEDEVDFKKLHQSTQEYKELLLKLAEEEFENKEGREHLNSEDGIAIGTLWAAMCVDDIMRTRAFIRGVDQAIQKVLATKNDIHFLYAGIGPFAALILPSIFRHADKSIRYTFLEINKNTLNAFQKVSVKLDLEKYHVSTQEANAIHYQINPNDLPDIVLSETMQNQLIKEHQVPIFINLMKQTSKDTIFIPEKVTVSLGFLEGGVPIEEQSKKHFSAKDTIFELSRERFSFWENIQKANSSYSFPAKQIHLPKETLSDYSSVYFLTNIQVFKNERLGILQSGLTAPIYKGEVQENKNFNMTAQYQLGAKPQLDYEITWTS